MDDVRRVLSQLMPKEAKVLTRQTVKDVAEEIAEEARQIMPVDQGDMRAGTRTKQERDKDGQGRASVRVRGAFYWRFLEYGDGPDGIEHAMFLRAKEKVLHNIETVAAKKFVQRLAARLAKVAGR